MSRKGSLENYEIEVFKKYHAFIFLPIEYDIKELAKILEEAEEVLIIRMYDDGENLSHWNFYNNIKLGAFNFTIDASHIDLRSEIEQDERSRKLVEKVLSNKLYKVLKEKEKENER